MPLNSQVEDHVYVLATIEDMSQLKEDKFSKIELANTFFAKSS